jgi:uncharacterized membrane protein
MNWLEDPKSKTDPKEKSVTLTVMVISAALVTIVIVAQLAGIKTEANLSLEFFIVSSGLYLGRKYTSKSGTSLDKE